MIHFCTKSDPPPVLILLPTMEVFGQKPSDKQKGRQTGKAKTGINSRAGFRTLIFCLSMLSPRMPSITSFCKNKTKPEVINK